MSHNVRNDWIDLLRGLSAIAVALFHFNSVPLSVPDSTSFWQDIWSHGHWGVGVFFALSGYCLYVGWSQSKGFGSFLLRRLQRIFPSYWCSVLLVAALASCTKLITGVNDVAQIPDRPASLLATLLLATNPLTPIATVNWVYWTLTVLLGFYLLMALLLLGPPGNRLYLLVALHALLCAADAIFNPPSTGLSFIVSYWPLFGAGLALAVYGARRIPGFTMLIVSAIHVLWSGLRGTTPDSYVFVAAGTVTAIAFVITLPLPKWLAPLARVGPFSYSLYLTHVPIGIYLAPRFLPDRYTSAVELILAQLFQLGLCLAVARLFYLIAERPFQPRSRIQLCAHFA